MPGTALAAALGSNRNAIYKALFEARRILRARLAATRTDLACRPGYPWMSPPWLDDLLAADPGDAGCDLAFHVLDRYAEGELNGTGPDNRFPGVAAHLRRCEACHQDYRGFLAAVERPRARAAREMTVMGASAAWSDQPAGFALADRIGPGADV